MIVTPYSPTSPSKTDVPEIRTAKKTLGVDDFMKLLATQFQSQDPMKPMEDTAFIAQMAQFTSLEQSTTLTAEMARLRTDQQYATANTYLGQQVTVKDGENSTATGIVSGIETSTEGPRLVVGGFTYPVSSVLLVQPGQALSTNPAANANGA